MQNHFIETKGTVTKELPNTLFRVQLDDGSDIVGCLSHKMRKNYVKVLLGDRVNVALTSHDSTQGCITQCLPSLNY